MAKTLTVTRSLKLSDKQTRNVPEIKGIAGVVELTDESGNVYIAPLLRKGYVDPDRTKGTTGQRKDGTRYVVESSGGPRMNNGGFGNYRSGADFGEFKLEVKLTYNDRDAKTAAKPQPPLVAFEF